jgi:protein-S-isoprenylcysteine O-methyltransferase Ste14
VFQLPPLTPYSLWIVLVPSIAIACAGMAIGDRLRGTKIEDVDHTSLQVGIVSGLPVLALIAVSIITPIAFGPLFWAGSGLAVLALIIYTLAIAAFVRAHRGVTRAGIYRLSRNPMYVSQFIVFAGFAFMAWSASALTGLLTTAIAVWNAGVVHWVVLSEERFLAGKYGNDYLTYKRSAPRYLGW